MMTVDVTKESPRFLQFILGSACPRGHDLIVISLIVIFVVRSIMPCLNSMLIIVFYGLPQQLSVADPDRSLQLVQLHLLIENCSRNEHNSYNSHEVIGSSLVVIVAV